MKYQIKQSQKLQGVCYDIRGKVLDEAKRLEEAGHSILKLNIGNPAPFGFLPPDEIITDVIRNLTNGVGYCDSLGLFAARKAVSQYYQSKGIQHIDVDRVFMGNGVSELILMAMQGLLNNDDEVLVPAPDYPLWTASIRLSGGIPRHYICDESADWFPDLADIEAKITPKTKALVVINPNNPTGSVYSDDCLQALCDLARKYNLVIFSDEIYDKILYDGIQHTPTMAFAQDLVCVTFNGLSKNYRAAGFRVGWMSIADPDQRANDYLKGLKTLASMRLCANVPNQFAVQTALCGYQSIQDLVKPGGRLLHQRNTAYDLLNAIPGISCVKPKGALYLFPKIDRSIYSIDDDEQLMLDLLIQEHILLVNGRAFNWPEPDHFRLVFLPHQDELQQALQQISHFFARLR